MRRGRVVTFIVLFTIFGAAILIHHVRTRCSPFRTAEMEIAMRHLLEEDEEREERGEHSRDGRPVPFDEPGRAAAFEAMKRKPPGAQNVPVERYFAAAAHNDNMPRYSSALSLKLPSSTSSPGMAGGVASALSTWSFLGPGNIGGRTRAIVIDPSSPGTMYAAGAAGGVWKTTTGGTSWSAAGDLLPNLAVNSLAMDPRNASILYAGTGEGYFNVDAVRG